MNRIVQTFFRRLSGLNRIIFWWNYCEKAIWFEPSCLLIKIFQKDYMHWTTLSFGENFPKKDHMSWTILSLVQIFLKRQYWLSHIVFWSKLSKNTVWVDHIVFLSKFCKETTWSTSCKKTISAELYCLLFKIFNKDNMVGSV